MNCGHCVRPVEGTQFGYWAIMDMFGQPSGYVPVHDDCRKNGWNKFLIPPAGVAIIKEIKLEHLKLLGKRHAKPS